MTMRGRADAVEKPDRIASASRASPRMLGLFGGGRARLRAPGALPCAQEATARSGAPLRVLIVEDKALIAMDLEAMLQDLGAEVVGIAMTAAEAVQLARLHRPDCATMDIRLKGDRDGVSAAIELYRTLGIRSIFVSAYGNAETRARAADANPIGWIRKPFGQHDLHALLEDFLGGE